MVETGEGRGEVESEGEEERLRWRGKRRGGGEGGKEEVEVEVEAEADAELLMSPDGEARIVSAAYTKTSHGGQQQSRGITFLLLHQRSVN